MRARFPIIGALVIGAALCWVAITPSHAAWHPSETQLGARSAEVFVTLAIRDHLTLHGPVYDCRVMARVADDFTQGFRLGCWSGYGATLRAHSTAA